MLVEFLLEVRYAFDLFVGVGDHFHEEEGEAGAAEFGTAAAVEVAVVDGFAVTGDAEAGWC